MSTQSSTVMPIERLAGILRELSVTHLFRPGDRPRLALDILWYRAMRFALLPREDAPRTVRLRDGAMLTYRLNRGDVQAIREVWRDDTYKPPLEAREIRYIIDLGANIGFTSLYLHRRFAPEYVIAVEPDPANAVVLRRNLAQNGIRSIVLEAAAGPVDGRARFQRARDSNIGRLEASGEHEVEVVSMPSILDRLPDRTGKVLLKIDIEGGEEELFRGDVSWLERIDCVQAELHPVHTDIDRIGQLLEDSGLRFRPAGGPGEPTTCWVRT